MRVNGHLWINREVNSGGGNTKVYKVQFIPLLMNTLLWPPHSCKGTEELVECLLALGILLSEIDRVVYEATMSGKAISTRISVEEYTRHLYWPKAS